jgi:hypothetical protein
MTARHPSETACQRPTSGLAHRVLKSGVVTPPTRAYEIVQLVNSRRR